MAYDPENIFAKILRGEIPCDNVYEDDTALAFKDINPQAPTHILIVPNKVIPTVNDVSPDDENTLGHLFIVARKLAEDEGIAEHGYRLLINCGAHGNQEVFHLHMHLVGGKPLGRMLSRNVREE